MKRKLASLLCLGLLLAGSASAAGFEVVAPPALGLTTTGGSAVAVEGAELTIDFTGGEKDALGLSPLGQITEVYRLTNPTAQAQTVTAALPYASPIEEGRALTATLTVDGAAADSQVYYGGLSSQVDLSTLGDGDILSRVLRSCPQEVPDGVLYTIIPNVDVETFLREELQIRFYVRVRFRCDTPVIYGGFGGADTMEDGRTELTAWIYPEKDRAEWPTLTLFLPGGGTLEELEVLGYDDYIGFRTPLGVKMEYETREGAALRDLVRLYMEGEGQAWEQSYWALLMDMERDGSGMPLQPLLAVAELIRYAQEYNRLALAVTELTLAPGETREVAARLALSGSVDQPEDPETGHTTYTYSWRSSPAQAWADFGGLTLTVLPPKGMRLTIDPAATPGEKGSYTLRWDAPPEEISFLLAPDGDASPWAALPVVPLSVGGVAAAAIVAALLLRRRARAKG